MRIGRGYPAVALRKKPIFGVADPSGMLVVYVSDFLATVSWTDNSTYNTSYTLERKRESGAWTTVSSSILGTATSHADPTALEPGITYTYRLTGYYLNAGTFSNSVSVSTVVPPEMPTNMFAACTMRAESNASKVVITWEINSLVETGFLIERSLNGVDWSTVTTTAAGVRMYEDTGLAHDTTYYYRVSAVSAGDTFSPTTSATVRTSRGRVADLQLAFDKKTGNFPLS